MTDTLDASKTLADLYVEHARDPRLRPILASYVTAYSALRVLAASLRDRDEPRFAEGVESRACDLARYAAEHADAVRARGR